MSAASITLNQALEDVEVRFLYNMPESELSKIDRLFFQIEQAWWFYEDFYADAPQNSHLPHFKKLNSFAKKIFEHCPLLGAYKMQYEELFADFSKYKSVIPSYGTILLNPTMTKVLLCQGYNSNSWTFPRGKVNENEDALTCACRETFEETGFDPTAHCAGEENAIIWIEEKKLCKLFIGTNIPEHTKFEPQTRKEIGNVAFHSFDSIVKSSKGTHVKTWGVVPFLSNLKRWIHNNRTAHTPISAVKPKEKAKTVKMKTENVAGNVGMANNRQITVPMLLTRASQAPSKSVTELSTASAFSLADPSTLGWSAKDMFKTNEKLTGKKLDDYDGNAHTFGATHPRYVNYAERDKSLKQSSVGNKSVELGTLSEEKVSSYADLLKQLHLHVPIYHSIGSDPDGKLIKLFPETNAFQFDLAAIKIALRPSAVV